MAITRRALLATTSASLLGLQAQTGPAHGRSAKVEAVLLDAADDGGGGIAVRYAEVESVAARGTDQWPFAPTGDEDVYYGAGGDGDGFEGSDRYSIVFAEPRLQVITDGQGRRTYAFGPAARGGRINKHGRNAAGPDGYKPNALFYDQRPAAREMHAFISRGTDPDYRRQAWLVTRNRHDDDWDFSPANLGTLGPGNSRKVFDATLGGAEYTPVGVCQRPNGSIHPDGRLYFYFNKQGNLKSDRTGLSADDPDLLYPSPPQPQHYQVYCARIAAPTTNLGRTGRIAWFRDKSHYSFRTASDWGSMDDAVPIQHDVANPDLEFDPPAMGKHFLVWWNPALGRFVAGKTVEGEYVWLGAATEPWGPFTQFYCERLDGGGVTGGKKFTAQLLPSPSYIETIDDSAYTVFPLLYSGHPEYDGLFVAKLAVRIGDG